MDQNAKSVRPSVYVTKMIRKAYICVLNFKGKILRLIQYLLKQNKTKITKTRQPKKSGSHMIGFISDRT